MIRNTCPICGAQASRGDGPAGRCSACGASLNVPCQPPAPHLLSSNGQVTVPTVAGSRRETIRSAMDAPAPIPFDSLLSGEPLPPILIPSSRRLGVLDIAGAGAKTGSGKDPAAERITERADSATAILHQRPPLQLGILNRYLICDHKHLVARWECNGQGWMLRMKDGFARIANIPGQIPAFGRFVLVEIEAQHQMDGLHLSRITPFRLQEHHALRLLTQGNDMILRAITGHSTLNERQKMHVRDYIKSHFLAPVWSVVDQLLAHAGPTTTVSQGRNG